MPWDHFDLVAGIYDRYGQFDAGRLFSTLLSLSHEHVLLDVGGGTGRVAGVLRELAREVIVVDTSPGMLKRSAAKSLPSVCAQSEALPVASKCIDRAIMVDAFHHVLNQQTTVFELWRALAPGGRIIILEPDIHRPFVKILAVIEKMLLMRSHILSGEKIAAMFERLGGIVTMHYEENNVILAVEKMRV